MKIRTLLMTLVILVVFNSCKKDVHLFCIKGNGTSITRSVQLDSFNSIDLETSAIVYIKEGEQNATISGDEVIVESILESSTLEGEQWNIKNNRCVKGNKNETTVITITLPYISRLNLSGSGSVQMLEYFYNVNNLNANVSGSGNMILLLDSVGSLNSVVSGSGNLDVSCAYSEINNLTVSGSGKVYMKGTGKDEEIRISGSGKVNAYNFVCKEAEVDVSGSGSAMISVLEYLNVNISGSGKVKYIGEPSIDVSISGSGSLENAN